jgi:outer membrane lipoprotein-sorting protein
LAAFLSHPEAKAANAGATLAAFEDAWSAVNGYRCTIVAHEVAGDDVQDRTYRLAFRKPHDTRLEIVAGAGKGGVAIWRGGGDVRGHRGGLLSFVHLTVGLHNPLVTTLRGTTIAAVNFGAVLAHWQALEMQTSIEVHAAPDGLELIAHLGAPTASGVTEETVVLGRDHLPTAYREYAAGQLVKSVRYEDVRTDAAIPESDFSLSGP